MSQPHPTIINAPLNFRTSDTLITTKVPHYPTKVNTGTLIIPGWTRPNANGMNPNINQADFNGPDFKARPLKHWRRQLRVYNNNGKGPSNNSRTARIADLDRPGLTVYHKDPDCACVDNEGGNSYIIANNKFSYETKGNQYSEPRSDSTIQNNGFNRVPSNATAAQVADPLTPAYEVLTGVYNTNCINCSPQHNVIKGAIAYNSQAYYADSFAKQQSRCQTYEQNISTNRADTSTYFGADGEPIWPNNSPLGPQVVEPVNYGSIIYKGNFFNLYDYPVIFDSGGVVSEHETLSHTFIPKIKCRPVYVIAGFYVNSPSLAALIQATIYDSNNNIICKSLNTEYTYINENPITIPTFNLASLQFYFPQNIYINPTTTYHILFKSVNNIRFYWFVVDRSSPVNSTLAGTLVAERLNCPSETIYKPNNIAFAKQGAVSGSTRLRKLAADTVMLNGSSFYSAAGAAAANLGLYQGTNVAGNYYVKMKPVIDSCIGGKPCVPFILSSEKSSTTVTLEWIDGNVCDYNSRLCNVLYYNLTYYPVSEPNNINHILIPASNVYTHTVKNLMENKSYNYFMSDTNGYTVKNLMENKSYNYFMSDTNGYTFTIKNLMENTSYNFFMSATNGNGTSDNSEIFSSGTLLIPSFGIFSIPSVTYNEKITIDITPPTSNSNGAFTYTGGNSDVATVSLSGLITIVGGGSVTITATQAATANYSQGSTSATFTVSKAVTKITLFPIPNQTYGNQPYQLHTPTSSRTGVFIFIYSSSNTNVATVSQSGLITIVGVGSVTITATQAATTNYLQGSTSATFTVAPVTPSFGSFSIPSVTYDKTLYEGTFFNLYDFNYGGYGYSEGSSQNVNSSNFTPKITCNVLYVTVGLYVNQSPRALIEATIYDSNNNIICKAMNTEYTYINTNPPYAPTFSSSSLKFYFPQNIYINPSTSYYYIQFKTINNINFDYLNDTNGKLSGTLVAEPNITITPPTSDSNGAFTYTGGNSDVATVSNNGLITIHGVGSVTITATQAATANYLQGSKSATFTVSKAVTTITPFTIPHKTYRDQPYQLPTPISSRTGDFVYSSSDTNVATVSLSGLITIIGVGSTTITVMQEATTTYLQGSTSATFTVDPVTPSFGSFSIPSVTYGNTANITVTPPTSNSNGVFTYTGDNSNVVIVSQSGLITIVGAGSTTISVTQAATDNYLVGTATATLTVKPAVTIIRQFTIPNKTYGDVPYQLPTPVSNSPTAFSYSSSSTNVATISQSGLITIVGGGSTTISVTQAATDNYLQGSESATFTVEPAVTKITQFTIPNKTYGDVPYQLHTPVSNSPTAFSYSSSNTNVATISQSGLITIVGGGSTTISVTQAATANYSQGSASAILTVTQAVTKITQFTIPNKTYGDVPYQLPTPISSRTGDFIFIYSSSDTNVATISQSGLITIVGGGSTTISVTQAATDNYLQGSESATFTVEPAEAILNSVDVYIGNDIQNLANNIYIDRAYTSTPLALILRPNLNNLNNLNNVIYYNSETYIGLLQGDRFERTYDNDYIGTFSNNIFNISGAPGKTTLTVYQPSSTNYKESNKISGIIQVFDSRMK
jgi:uncharacterized protein YjdB